MILHVHSNASYLSEPKACSRVGGFFFLADGTKNPAINGPIHVNSQIMQNVMASAAEAEVGGLFINAQTACPLRQTLEELGHPQPGTVIVTDNACAKGIAEETVKQKRSKAIDMRFYWIRDRIKQNQFIIKWKRGVENLADYFTKHHPPSHHQRVRSRYLQQANTVSNERHGPNESMDTSSQHTKDAHKQPQLSPNSIDKNTSQKTHSTNSNGNPAYKHDTKIVT
jgi:hypothetical protein